MSTDKTVTHGIAGAIVTAAGQLEERLAAMGAEGIGLRDKAESLRGGLPETFYRNLPEVTRMRNLAAHEPDSGFSRRELAMFNAFITEMNNILDNLNKNCTGAGKTEEKRTEQTAGGKINGFALIPGLHLLYALHLLLAGIAPGTGYLILLAGNIIAPILFYCRIDSADHRYGIAAGILLLIVWIAGMATGEKSSDKTKLKHTKWIPVLNTAFFMFRLIRCLDLLAMTAAAVILGTAAISWHLLNISREPIAAAAILALSYIAAAADAVFRRRRGCRI